MRVNSTIETTLQDEDLHEIARINPPAGVELLGVSIRVAAGSADLDQFELHGKIGDAQFNFADAQGEFTSPQWPIRRASGDLTALGAGEAGYLVLDVRGLSEIVLYAASAAFDTAGGTLTASGNVSNGDTVQIGDVVYTFVSALTEAAASATLTGDSIQAGDTVTIGDVTYTFVDALSNPAVPYEVLVGEDDSGSLDNLIAAINGAAGEGTAYGTGTEAHPLVSAAAGDGDTMDVTAKAIGDAGNSIEVSASLTSGDWGSETLEGGADPVPYEVAISGSASGSLDNLIAAINGAAGEGSTYSTGTEAHPQVTASAGDGDTMDVTPDNGAGSYANSIATLTDAANLSWGDDTLTGGAGPTLVTVNFYA